MDPNTPPSFVSLLEGNDSPQAGGNSATPIPAQNPMRHTPHMSHKTTILIRIIHITHPTLARGFQVVQVRILNHILHDITHPCITNLSMCTVVNTHTTLLTIHHHLLLEITFL